MTVTGVPAGAEASLKAHVNGPPGLVGLAYVGGDTRCRGNIQNITCTVTPGPFRFIAAALARGTVDFTVTATDVDDPDLDNNTATVTFD